MDLRYDDGSVDDGSVLDTPIASRNHGRKVIQGVRADIDKCARHIMFAIGAENHYDAKYFVHVIELLEERIVNYHYGFKGWCFSCFVQVGRKGQSETLTNARSRRVSATAMSTSALCIIVYVNM